MYIYIHIASGADWPHLLVHILYHFVHGVSPRLSAVHLPFPFHRFEWAVCPLAEPISPLLVILYGWVWHVHMIPHHTYYSWFIFSIWFYIIILCGIIIHTHRFYIIFTMVYSSATSWRQLYAGGHWAGSPRGHPENPPASMMNIWRGPSLGSYCWFSIHSRYNTKRYIYIHIHICIYHMYYIPIFLFTFVY